MLLYILVYNVCTSFPLTSLKAFVALVQKSCHILNIIPSLWITTILRRICKCTSAIIRYSEQKKYCCIPQELSVQKVVGLIATI